MPVSPKYEPLNIDFNRSFKHFIIILIQDEDDDTDGRASPPPIEQLEQRRITSVGQ